MPKRMNSSPPVIATALSEIMDAMPLPPNTAAPVQMAWPKQPPAVTPITFALAAKPMVATWLRSPHSARNVNVNAFIMMGFNKAAGTVTHRNVRDIARVVIGSSSQRAHLS